MPRITGRRVAIRMTIVGGIVLTLGLIFTVVFADPEFTFFGIVGVLGTALSTLVAIYGQDATAVPVDGQGGGRAPGSRD